MLREGVMAPFMDRRNEEMRGLAEDDGTGPRDGLEARNDEGSGRDRRDNPNKDGNGGNGKKNGDGDGNGNKKNKNSDDNYSPPPGSLEPDPDPVFIPVITLTSPSPTTPTPASTPTPTPTIMQQASTIVMVSKVTPTVLSMVTPTITSCVPIVTSGGVAFGGDVSSQPRKGVDGKSNPASFVTSFESTLSADETGTALAEQGPQSTASPGNGHGKCDGEKHHDRDKGKVGDLDPTAEHLLISAGSIGAFILVCFVCWICWLTMKKSRRDDGAGDTGRRLIPNSLASKVPFLRQRTWQNLDDETMTTVPPPSYREKASIAGAQSIAGFYGQDKPMFPQQQQQQQAGEMSGTAPQIGLSRSGTINSQFSFMNNTNTFNANQINAMVMNAGLNTTNTGTMNTMNTINSAASANAVGFSHQAQPSFSSMNAQFGSGNGTMQTMMTMTDPNDTMRSGMTQNFFNQSELARNPSNAYDPARIQVNRASELSSLSSGFGDGDIIIPEEYLLRPPQPPQAAATNVRQSSNNFKGRFSWMSRSGGSSRNSNSPRDTIYTQTSEDSPPRFRSVSSWVNQQTSRIRRAQQRADDEQLAPPVPQLPGGQLGVPGLNNGMPAEQSFNMMMNDGEEPRRVEDALASRPSPVPATQSSQAFSITSGATSTPPAAGATAGTTAS